MQKRRRQESQGHSPVRIVKHHPDSPTPDLPAPRRSTTEAPPLPEEMQEALDMVLDPPAPRFRHHERFYHTDGTVVIAAKPDRARDPPVLFRVSRCHLESMSPRVKAALEDLSVPEHDIYDNCPLWRIKESATDVEALFTVVWDVYSLDPSTLSSPQIVGALRMSSKWEMPVVTEWSLKILGNHIPRTLDELLEDPKLERFKEWIPPATVLKLASQLIQFPSKMTAIAWYYLLIQDWCSIPEDTEAQLRQPDGQDGDVTLKLDLKTLVIGRENMLNKCALFWSIKIDSLSFQTAPCMNTVAANQAPCTSKDIKTGHSGCRSMTALLQRPFEWYDHILSNHEEKFCGTCREKLSSMTREFLGELFSELPALFHLNE